MIDIMNYEVGLCLSVYNKENKEQPWRNENYIN
jgi:hypothetical protein